jgi:hypothetical protein
MGIALQPQRAPKKTASKHTLFFRQNCKDHAACFESGIQTLTSMISTLDLRRSIHQALHPIEFLDFASDFWMI